MANSYITNSTIRIDSAGTVTTDSVTVVGVEVIPDADSHVAVLNDANGNQIFYNTSEIANHRTPGPSGFGPTKWDGVVAMTLTNITAIFVRLYSIPGLV